jgi:hypothetical protein
MQIAPALGFLVINDYVYSLNSKVWPVTARFITFIFLQADDWSGLIYIYGTRL